MKKFLAAIAVLAIAGVLAWMNWDKIGPIVNPILGIQTAAAATTETGPTTLGAAPDQRYRFALIDPTTSTDTSFRESMKNDIIAAVQSYVPAKPTETKAGVAAITGLQLTVRLVGTNSLAYGQPNVAISIPSVPELPARPDMTAPGALDPGGPYDTWKKSEAAWSAAYDAAVAAVATSVQSLQGVNVNTDEYSGILAGTAALALLAPPDGDVAFAVLSDLDENRGAQPANFNGHPFLVVQPDPVGDINRWNGLFNTFSSWATSSDAGQITRVRPEDASAAITTFITGS
ncbi:MAG TPA: hypothetical protein PKE29_06120 [Phycisphaerales bacterium]|nr:hypothetical protein [Phycisphaerales bacterium]